MVLGKYMFTLNFCGFREKENNTAQLMSVSVETPPEKIPIATLDRR